MEIQLMPVAELVEHFAEYNPRQITEANLIRLQQSIEEFGFVVPVVYNRLTERVISGHQRIRAAGLAGVAQIPVTVIEMEEPQEKKLNLALNKIEGRWDYQLLEETIMGIMDSDPDLEITLTGFSQTDLAEIFASTKTDVHENAEEVYERLVATNKTQAAFITFQSPEATFTCSMSSYQALLLRLHNTVGMSRLAMNRAFFELIGLGGGVEA